MKRIMRTGRYISLHALLAADIRHLSHLDAIANTPSMRISSLGYLGGSRIAFIVVRYTLP